MNDPPKNEDRELIDMLIAISVVSRHLARKLEMKGSENDHEPDEQPGNDPGRDDTDRESNDRMRRKPDQNNSVYKALAGGRIRPVRNSRHKSGKPEYVPVCQPYGMPGYVLCKVLPGTCEDDQGTEEQNQNDGKHQPHGT